MCITESLWCVSETKTIVWTNSGGGLVIKSCLILVTPWIGARQAPVSTGFSRQEYWSGLSFPCPGDLPDPGIEPWSPALQADSLPTEPRGNPIKLTTLQLKKKKGNPATSRKESNWISLSLLRKAVHLRPSRSLASWSNWIYLAGHWWTGCSSYWWHSYPSMKHSGRGLAHQQGLSGRGAGFP